MKVDYRTTSIFGVDAEAYVNPVNCVGIMGGGLALKFKDAYPLNYNAYHRFCIETGLLPGQLYVHNLSALINPKWIVNLATKNHWKNPSRTVWVRDGMNNLFEFVKHENIKSVAIPMLGCGLGGLDWQTQVKPIFEEVFKTYEDLDCLVTVLV